MFISVNMIYCMVCDSLSFCGRTQQQCCQLVHQHPGAWPHLCYVCVGDGIYSDQDKGGSYRIELQDSAVTAIHAVGGQTLVTECIHSSHTCNRRFPRTAGNLLFRCNVTQWGNPATCSSVTKSVHGCTVGNRISFFWHNRNYDGPVFIMQSKKVSFKCNYVGIRIPLSMFPFLVHSQRFGMISSPYLLCSHSYGIT